MQIEKYFRSLSEECNVLKSRVRLLINDRHWPTDGEWKESVLRSMIRRSSPENVTVGRGFVVTHEQCSSQIDVLIYDNTLPILYKDGDLVFITPASCRAIIEVKSKVSVQQFSAAAKKLAENAAFIRNWGMGVPLFVGFFSFDVQHATGKRFLNALQNAAKGDPLKIIDHVAFGDSRFIKYWQAEPRHNDSAYDSWHLYNLPGMAPGYFIHNLLTNVSRDITAKREEAWFPQESKEVNLEERLKFSRNVE